MKSHKRILFKSACNAPVFLILVALLISLPVPGACNTSTTLPFNGVETRDEHRLADFNTASEPTPNIEYHDTKNKYAATRDTRLNNRQQNNTVLLNFIDAQLKDILHTISEITGQNFILGAGVSGKITVQSSTPIPKKEVLGIFQSILEVNGLSAVRIGNYYKIITTATAKKRGVEVSSERGYDKVSSGDKIITHIIPVKFISAKDLTPILQQMLSPAGSIFNYSKTDTLIITDIASNIKKALKIISLLDVDAFKRMYMALVAVRNVDTMTVYKELSTILQSIGLGKDAKQLSVIPLERLNSLIVFSSNKKIMESVKEWISRLDLELPAGGRSTSKNSPLHIYYVENESATNIKSILDQLLGAGDTSLPAASSQKTRQIQLTPNTKTGSGDYVGSGGAYGNISVFLYKPLNALIVQSSERDYQHIVGIIKKLDKIPKQVLIDALIVEVTLDENTKYGIQWSMLSGNVSGQQNTGIFSNIIQDPQAAINNPIGLTAPPGLTLLATDASKFFAIVQALASTGKVKVLSNPHIVVKNYEKASISIGSEEPIATQSTQTAVTGTQSLIQNIEYRKTGIILTVIPQITGAGMVAMNIKQEISDISTNRVVGSGTFPSFSKREVETSVVSKDKETIVIGGLIKEKTDKTISSVPLLSKIPLFGNLFKHTSINNVKTELVILLTPVIISNSEDATSLTEEFKNKIDGLKKILKDNERHD